MSNLTLSANIDGFLAETGALYIANGISDATPLLSIDTNNRQLIASDGYGGTRTMLDWTDPSGFGKIDLLGNYLSNIYNLADSSDFPSVFVNDRYLVDSSNYSSLDWATRSLYDGSGYYSVDWNYRTLYDTSGNYSVDWGNRYLFDSTGYITSLDWQYRYLYDYTGNTIADWGNTSGYGMIVFSSLDASGYASAGGAANFPFGATLAPTAVSSLVGNEGTIAYVNDADTPVIGSAVVSGGSAKCLVCYNDTSWIVTALL